MSVVNKRLVSSGGKVKRTTATSTLVSALAGETPQIVGGRLKRIALIVVSIAGGQVVISDDPVNLSVPIGFQTDILDGRLTLLLKDIGTLVGNNWYARQVGGGAFTIVVTDIYEF